MGGVLGMGIDIIEVARIKKAIERWGDHFLNHVFNREEIDYSMQFKNAAEHFAVRFAAKEAVYKAVGDRPKLGWKDLTIYNDPYGRPCCRYHDASFPNTILISLSHTENYAVASAVVTQGR